MQHPPPSSLHLHCARSALHAGGVVACPTEAVWGLSCDPFDEDAVSRLLWLKRRPVHKGLILVASSAAQFEFLLAELSVKQRATLDASWPGPATWLVPHRGLVPRWISGRHSNVALRVSAHPVVQALCYSWQGPLVSTSANPAGARPALHAFQAHRYFGANLDYLLPGRLGVSAQPTTIRDLVTGQIIRD